MKRKSIGYWTTTVIVGLSLLVGGASNLLHRPDNVAGLVGLGYPVYLLSILGAWKVLGGIVLLAPRLPRLKEWAYAGAVFDLTGAAISHAVCGHGAGDIGWPLVLAACAIASWALRPASRSLGATPITIARTVH